MFGYESLNSSEIHKTQFSRNSILLKQSKASEANIYCLIPTQTQSTKAQSSKDSHDLSHFDPQSSGITRNTRIALKLKWPNFERH